MKNIAWAESEENELFFHDSGLGTWLDLASKKNALRIPTPEWLEHFVPAQEIVVQFRKPELMTNMQTRLELIVLNQPAGDTAKILGKARKVLLRHR